MAVVAVVISTDHPNPDDAVRSVMGNMKRAGYDVLNYLMEESKHPVVVKCDAQIEVCEPEVNPHGNDN